MKIRFTTYDIVCQVAELQRLVGMRVNQIYDIDNKTYLIRLNQGEEKPVLLLESGNRFHTTAFEWPKNVAPSGFTMKLRKHLKNKRLEKLEQLGIDRIVDFQFGVGEAAYHVIVELYDRGNIILADYEMTILNILRPHVEGEEEVRFAVREKYPTDRSKPDNGPPSMDTLRGIIENASPGCFLKGLLVPILDYGPSLIEHILLKYDLIGCQIGGEPEAAGSSADGKPTGKKNKKNRNKSNAPARQFDMDTDLPKLISAVNEAETILRTGQKVKSSGYIIQKAELKPSEDTSKEAEYFYHNVEYHPYNFHQNKDRPMKEVESFDAAVDEFYSAIEGQKIDLKTMHQEREALKKLSNVKKDHAKRLEDLSRIQLLDRKRADLITRNQKLVDNAILAIQSALASQMSWPDIEDLVKTAQSRSDPVAKAIKQLKLESNHISLYLTDPYKGASDDEEEGDNSSDEDDPNNLKPMTIDIDLMLSAFSNARRYYDQKRTAAKKEQRTIDAAEKAMKSAEKKTQQTLKEVRTISTITKARKLFWFEKFYWFISSENYLVIGGRDGQQNELIVKRYMRASDIYVHAEIQGASSVVIRNPTGEEVPPKTLLEAGAMAISYSVAWDAKVVTNAYWVRSDQVSKTAPTGEYLGTGSFMIRGKKNFLPPCHLILGLSFMFRLEDSSIERHRGERRVRTFEEDFGDRVGKVSIENEKLQTVHEEDQEVQLIESDDEQDQTPDKDTAAQQSSDDDSDNNFPNTHIKVSHDTGKVTVIADPKLERLTSQEVESTSITEDAPFLIQPLPPKIKQMSKTKQKQKQKENEKKMQQEAAVAAQKDDESKTTRVTRGKRGKMKKIKEKYKDQDDEERQMRMELLKSAGKKAPERKVTEDDEQKEVKEPKEKPNYPKAPAQVDPDDGEDVPATADVEMLDSLTGCPVEEDEILFAVPVIAPYQTLQNYKFKVKLTPGTGRRGKAAKTALLMFMKDKSCSPRERDLLKGVKDESLARNIPGKVKLSAPQLQKYKK